MPTATLSVPPDVAAWPMATLLVPVAVLSAPVLFAWKYLVPVL